MCYCVCCYIYIYIALEDNSGSMGTPLKSNYEDLVRDYVVSSPKHLHCIILYVCGVCVCVVCVCECDDLWCYPMPILTGHLST